MRRGLLHGGMKIDDWQHIFIRSIVAGIWHKHQGFPDSGEGPKTNQQANKKDLQN